MQYSTALMAHFEQPHGVGSFDPARPDVGTGSAGSVEQGDVVRLQIAVDAGAQTVAQTCFKAHGSAAMIATASLLTQTIEGMALEAASRLQGSALAQSLQLPPIKMHCALLAEDALRAAIADYQAKRQALAVHHE
ncbi:iron-sulfur cluster assembly scaffold protein [Comamonas faecalis]